MNDFKQATPPSRVIIDRIQPDIDGGKFAAKFYIDQPIRIEAVLLTDGHDLVKARVHIRHENETEAFTVPMSTRWNDEWSAEFKVKKTGRYLVRVEAGLNRFAHWREALYKKANAGQAVELDLLSGAELLKSIANESRSRSAPSLVHLAQQLKLMGTAKSERSASAAVSAEPAIIELKRLLDDPVIELLAHDVFDKQSTVFSEREIPIQVESARARCSSWYEFFPRSTVAGMSAKHGTLNDAVDRLGYVQELGFNVLYLPPVHPLGTAYRKGKNNSLTPTSSDVGSPWAIGAKEGGHKAIHPELGTLEDFDRLVTSARELGIDIAMDMAFQCSPDHPYVKAHPEWFKKRADGSIQYAENPPKKYQDIYPLDFESKDWRGLWKELRDVLQFWVDRGVRIFRVDNPHTKAFHFWEWVIREIKLKTPDVIFLAEAFTRPHIMAYLAKIGFTQSYTYFTWRNLKWELEQYMTELTGTELKHYFSPNFWPNTPDINPESLHTSNEGAGEGAGNSSTRAIYLQRLMLAATLSSNYGIYGPVFELMQGDAKGKEEYLDSEKYELRQWDLNAGDSIAPEIKLINQIRLENPCLQQNRNFELIPIANEQMIAFSKWCGDERVLVVINLDCKNIQSGILDLPLEIWKINGSETFEVKDLLTGTIYHWTGWKNYVELNPAKLPAHIFKINRYNHASTALKV